MNSSICLFSSGSLPDLLYLTSAMEIANNAAPTKRYVHHIDINPKWVRTNTTIAREHTVKVS